MDLLDYEAFIPSTFDIQKMYREHSKNHDIAGSGFDARDGNRKTEYTFVSKVIHIDKGINIVDSCRDIQETQFLNISNQHLTCNINRDIVEYVRLVGSIIKNRSAVLTLVEPLNSYTSLLIYVSIHNVYDTECSFDSTIEDDSKILSTLDGIKSFYRPTFKLSGAILSYADKNSLFVSYSSAKRLEYYNTLDVNTTKVNLSNAEVYKYFITMIPYIDENTIKPFVFERKIIKGDKELMCAKTVIVESKRAMEKYLCEEIELIKLNNEIVGLTIPDWCKHEYYTYKDTTYIRIIDDVQSMNYDKDKFNSYVNYMKKRHKTKIYF